jgi:hypothetical protein
LVVGATVVVADVSVDVAVDLAAIRGVGSVIHG